MPTPVYSRYSRVRCVPLILGALVREDRGTGRFSARTNHVPAVIVSWSDGIIKSGTMLGGESNLVRLHPAPTESPTLLPQSRDRRGAGEVAALPILQSIGTKYELTPDTTSDARDLLRFDVSRV